MSDPSLALKVYDRASVSENTFKPMLIPKKKTHFTEPIINSSLLFKKRYLFLKRVVDIAISLAVITLLLWWLLPLLALMIKIDSRGPVLFIQKRNKKQGGVFNCIKLRTMTVSDTHIHITRLGKFLRKSHLDELPQFINVLRADMSVVGPRPHMLAENIKYNKVLSFYDDRHFVKPGITGLAQSYGYHGPVTNLLHLNKKIGYDIVYIQNWTPAMDIKIVARTVCMIFKKLKPGL